MRATGLPFLSDKRKAINLLSAIGDRAGPMQGRASRRGIAPSFDNSKQAHAIAHSSSSSTIEPHTAPIVPTTSLSGSELCPFRPELIDTTIRATTFSSHVQLLDPPPRIRRLSTHSVAASLHTNKPGRIDRHYTQYTSRTPPAHPSTLPSQQCQKTLSPRASSATRARAWCARSS